MKKLVGKYVTPCVDLKAGEKNDGVLLFSQDKKYKVWGLVNEPTQNCVLLVNELGRFDIIHISNLKPARRFFGLG